MFEHYAKTLFRPLHENFRSSVRALRREKFFSALNILGLTAALACCVFIALWIWDEWRHDRFFPNADRIVRVAGTVFTETEVFDHAVSSAPMGPALKNDYPEVEDFVRLNPNETAVRTGTRQFAEKHALTADASFFRVFDYRLREGDARSALLEPYTVVLSEKLARKYFGDQSPLGQTLSIPLYDSTGRGALYRVTGVLDGEARPAHFTFDLLISFSTFLAFEPELLSEDGWGNNSYYTYLLLKPGADSKALEAKLPAFYDKYVAPVFRKYGATIRMAFTLQPLSGIYLHSDRRYEIAPTSSADKLYVLGTVGLLILLMSGINYVNMVTAQAAKRARSVGVRKVLGAHRRQLAGLFLAESVLTALCAAALALALAAALQPLFERLTGKPFGVFDIAALPFSVLAGGLLLGLGAGAYPAFVLSGFRPAEALKSHPGAGFSGGAGLRKMLVVVQFSISIALICGVLVIRRQMNFIQNKDLGYDKEALLTLNLGEPNETTLAGVEPFRHDVTALSGLVRGMTVSHRLPVGGLGNNAVETTDMAGKAIRTSIFLLRADYDYADVYKLRMAAGRNFSRDFPADLTDSTRNYLLNEAAVQAFGWGTPENAIGKSIAVSGRRGIVVGIVQNFHFNSLKHKVEPVAIHLPGQRFSQITLRIDMRRAAEAIAEIKRHWEKHFPDTYFDYAFLDEKLDEQYRSELRFGALFGTFSIFSILIACLGLFGLAAYAAEQRTKEIGIRKVLGATTAGIVALLSKDFLALVLAALFIASPAAYFFLEKWLQDFAYRIDLQWWMFALSGAAALAIAFLTVGFQSVRAALANPAQSLKSE